jgi:hypothetical protein
MKKRRVRMLAIGVVALTPFLASACRIDIGNGCELLIAEPGANVGVVCN